MPGVVKARDAVNVTGDAHHGAQMGKPGGRAGACLVAPEMRAVRMLFVARGGLRKRRREITDTANIVALMALMYLSRKQQRACARRPA